MIKIQPSFKYSGFHVNYFTIFSLITTFSTDVTKSLQCKAINIIYIYILYIYIYIKYIWSQKYRQYALPVITNLPLASWSLMHLVTHVSPLRSSNRLSCHVMSSTRTQSQLCTATHYSFFSFSITFIYKNI